MGSYFYICVQTLLLGLLGASLVTGEVSGLNLSSSDQNDYALCTSQVCNETGILIMENIKPSVNPCDDFYEHACGGWVEKNPANKNFGSYTQFKKVLYRSTSQIKELLETDDTSDIEAVRKVKDIYRSCVDIRAINDRGISPLRSMVCNNGGWPLTIPLNSWNLKCQNLPLQSIYENYIKMGAPAPLFRINVKHDIKNPNVKLLSIKLQATTGLQRGYLKKISKLDELKPVYIHDINEVVANFVNHEINGSDTIEKDVENMINFEIALTGLYKSRWEVPHQTTIEELQRSWDTAVLDLPDYAINWLEIICSYFHGTNIVIDVTEKIEIPSANFVQKFVNLLKNTNFSTIVNYIQWFEIDALSSFASWKLQNITKKISQKTADFQGISKRIYYCLIQNKMRHAWSYMWVQRYSSRESLDTIEDIVSNIQSEIKRKIGKLSWINDNDKIRIKEKIDSMVKYIGYPSWYDEEGKMNEYYDKLKIGKNYFENMLSIRLFQQMQNFSDFRKALNETKFEIRGTDTDISYEAEHNLLDISPFLFQMPLFHHNLPVAMQYGGMGVYIAYAILQGFYQEGREFNKHGNRKQLWANSTIAEFNEKAKCFVQQPDKYALLKNYNNWTIYVNGTRTQIQHIADTIRIAIGIEAYHAYRNEHKSKDVRITGFTNVTGEQLFFYSLANSFCASYTPEFIREYLENVMPLRLFRALSNSNEFSGAFNCPIASPMNPETKLFNLNIAYKKKGKKTIFNCS